MANRECGNDRAQARDATYRALSADASRLFRLLGLHPAPDFSAHAAATLAEVPEQAG